MGQTIFGGDEINELTKKKKIRGKVSEDKEREFEGGGNGK